MRGRAAARRRSGVTADEVRDRFPEVFQWLADRVKPERDESRRESYRKNWWVLGEPQPALRTMTAGLLRFIASPVTAKHRFFVFLDSTVLADQALNVFALDDAYFLGVLSSRIHVVWALATGARLGVGNDPRYNNSRCFDPFPFPTATEAQQTHIRDLAERLDTHRKRQQAQHPKLTFTDLYNVLEKLRAGTPLNAKEQLTHEQGLVTVLRQLHDDLDDAVASAYALPPTASDEAILTHLCALNAPRAAEERTGTIRWLRPTFQNPTSTATQTNLTGDGMEGTDATHGTAPAKPAAKFAWPKSFAEQALAVRTALTTFAAPAAAATLAKTFKGAKADRIEDILETLASLGQARALPGERFVAA